MLTSVGELSINKNRNVIIKALRNTSDSSIHYSVAGQGELEKELRNLLEPGAIEKRTCNWI